MLSRGSGILDAGCSGHRRLVDQVKYIRNNYFPAGRPSVPYPRAEMIPHSSLRCRGLHSASLEGFDTEKGFTEQHSSSRCKVARVTSLRVPWRGSDAQTKADASRWLCFQKTHPWSPSEFEPPPPIQQGATLHYLRAIIPSPPRRICHPFISPE